jgi:hypothetical protein
VAPPDRAAPETGYGGYEGRGIAAPRSNLGEIGEASRAARANSTCRLEAVISQAEMKKKSKNQPKQMEKSRVRNI